MNNYTKKLQNELLLSKCIPVIEIEVIAIDGSKDWVYCEVYFKGNSLIAERDAVSIKEQKSKFIASSRIVVDNCFSLDEHLQSLSEQINYDIISGELFELFAS